MTTNYANDGKLGVDLENAGGKTTPDHKLGTVARVGANKTAIYVYFGEAVTYSSSSAVPIAINAGFTASVSAGGFTATQTYASGEYGWVLTSAADVTLG